MRWDSDHYVIFDDPTRGIMEEVVRGGFLNRTHIGLDFFDASINWVAAWVLGTCSTLKVLLAALLEPAELLRTAENSGYFTASLALLEESKTLLLGAVWEEHCRRQNTPGDRAWLAEVKAYEAKVETLEARKGFRLGHGCTNCKVDFEQFRHATRTDKKIRCGMIPIPKPAEHLPRISRENSFFIA